MARLWLTVVVAALVAVSPAFAAETTIQYDDGESEGYMDGTLTGDIEAFRLTTAHPATLKTLRLQINGGDAGGDTELHLWAEFGGNNCDLNNDLIPPTMITVAPGSDWYDIDVSAAEIEIEPWWNFHVGIIHLQDGLPGLLLDLSAPNPDIRTQYFSVADDTWYYIGDSAGSYAYMVRAVVEYHDEIDPADKPFQDVSDAAGLPRTGARPAWADYDNDGDPDLLLSGSLLYRNNGDGTFTDVTEAAGLTGMPGSGGIWADFDNDDWLDIYVATSAYEVYYNHLLHSNGDGTFTDITLDAFGGEDLFNWENTEALGLGDYDLDGDVDVYAGAYERADLGSCPYDKFFRNNGDLTLTDISEPIGLRSEMFQCARGVQWIDFNDDGWPDIHVSNYRLDPNFLWVNYGDGQPFVNEAEERGLAGADEGDGYYGHTIGSAWGDLNLDGVFDVVDANLAHPRFIDFSDKTMVLISGGAPDYLFTDMRELVGVRYMETHSNPNLVDVDNDGDLDLFITGVYVGYKSHLYLNRLVEEGTLRFEFFNYPSGIWVDSGWGSAWADYDNDGDMDLFATGLWRNGLTADNNWIKIEAHGRTANHAAIGARIIVEAGGQTYVREIQGGSGTTTQDDLVAHVGIGGASVIEQATVKFPGGGTATKTNVAPNQTLSMVDPEDGDDDTADDDDNPPGGDDDDADDDDEGCGC